MHRQCIQRNTISRTFDVQKVLQCHVTLYDVTSHCVVVSCIKKSTRLKTVLTELGNRHCIHLRKHICPPPARRITLSIRRLDQGDALIQKFNLALVCHYVC